MGEAQMGHQLGLYGLLRLRHGSHVLGFMGVQNGLWVPDAPVRRLP